jgi:SAM-dependent methyltransferase
MSDVGIVKLEAIQEAVLERYGRIAETFEPAVSASCCEPSSGSCCDSAEPSDDYFANLYQEKTVADLPADVTGLSLGCGDPITLANLKEGQTVLDLGSGGGIDVFLAAKQVGESGKAIGVDMTPAMLEKARANQEKIGAQNVEFRYGQIESLPVEDNTVDVIISNCVINLSVDKPAVFREAFRVLKQGGRLAVSDMVTLGQFNEEQRADLVSWSGCIAGAEAVGFYVEQLQAAGFTNISIRERGVDEVELATAVLETPAEPRLFSARITAEKAG